MNTPDFLIIPYQLIEDANITAVEERLYAVVYWYSKLKNEKCTASNETLAKMCKTTSRVIANSLTNLEKFGYIKRTYKDEARRVRSEICPLISFSRVSPTDDRVSPTDDTRVSPTDEQNKNIYNKNSKEYISEPARKEASPLIPSIIKEMESIDPKNKAYYKNKSQREACQFLIDEYGYENVIKVIQSLPALRLKVPYLPSVTTPCELRDKWQKMKDAVDRERNKNKPTEVNFA